MSHLRACLVLAASLLVGVVSAGPAAAVSPSIVISEVYGGGGNSGATYRNDFIELFNRGTSAVSVTGWSVQYASATGTTWQVTNLSGSIAPGQYYLVQEAQGAGGTTNLPTPDATGTIAMSGTAGKVALVNTTAALTGSCPTGTFDLVGFGTTANCFEGSGPAPAPSNTNSDQRASGGCTETDQNAADFAVAAAAPQNTAAALAPCGGGGGGTTLSINDATVTEGNTATTTATFTVTLSAAAPAGGVTFDIATQDGTATAGSDYVARSLTAQTIPAGSTTSTFDVTVNGDTTYEPNETFLVNVTNVVGATVSDGQGQGTITNDDAPPTVAIHTVQGSTHLSPLAGMAVTIEGVVTALRSNGFYMQDPLPDADVATSEAIFVFTSTIPATSVGNSVRVSGTVAEFRPGGGTSANLTTTEITGPTVTTLSSGNPLPAPTTVGPTGTRTPPAEIIEDDATGDVETSGVFDPAADGIDFYESLEAMLVQVNNPVAVGPTNRFGEIPVLAEDGAGQGVRTARGGIVIRPTDFNPERIILDDGLTGVSTPAANVGDHFSSSVTAVVDYGFGNFKFLLTATPTVVAGSLAPETTAATLGGHVSIATFNVENLDPGDGAAKFNALAGLVVNNLKSPDIVALEEIQDNNGPTNDAVVDASTTYSTLITAIQTAGGPTYQFRQIDPVDDQDGGEPGGNIRVGFIFRTDRGLAFVDRPGGTSTAANTVMPNGDLAFSPGRIDPTNAAFANSRKPLAAEFTFAGQRLYLIANHFNSKGGDQPLFGHFQPPVRSSETQRHQQATIVANFVSQIETSEPNAQVIVLGDINDFEFSQTVTILEGGGLTTMMDTLPQSERYSYVFDGNSQSLDQILVSNPILFRSPIYDVVHVNAEFASQVSDHDPQVLQYDPTSAPTAVEDRSLAAVQAGRTVLLRWRTGSTARVLGFNVYRSTGKARVRLNRSLIAVRGSSYAWRDRRPARTAARYWLQVVHLDGSRTWRGPGRAR